MVTHRGLSNTVQEMKRAFEVRDHSRILQMASLSFDASVFEIVWALAAGGTLCLIDREKTLPGPELGDWLIKARITHVAFSPSVLAMIPELRPPNPRVIVVAGESCPASLVAKWRSGRQFINLYGATEASIYSTMERCEIEARAPAVGRPVGNARAHVLEAGLAPVALGVTGEIYLGGEGVTRGYWKRPALTASKFVPDPYGGSAGGRLYRTGDLGKQREDGKIEFAARVDHQVKIRGYRIELGEIENALADHDRISECAVVAHTRQDRESELVAYVVTVKGEPLTRDDTRRHLSKKLPAYMIPGLYVFLDKLPLTANGKVDREALPDAGYEATAGEIVAPRDWLETRLVEIWEELLGVSPIGVTQKLLRTRWKLLHGRSPDRRNRTRIWEIAAADRAFPGRHH